MRMLRYAGGSHQASKMSGSILLNTLEILIKSFLQGSRNDNHEKGRAFASISSRI